MPKSRHRNRIFALSCCFYSALPDYTFLNTGKEILTFSPSSLTDRGVGRLHSLGRQSDPVTSFAMFLEILSVAAVPTWPLRLVNDLGIAIHVTSCFHLVFDVSLLFTLLQSPQLGVITIVCQQLVMRALFNHFALLQYHYLIGIDHGG